LTPFSIYIHIPFCKSKCFYCAFYSCLNTSRSITSYVQALIKEIDYQAENLDTKNYELTTIYFGGGTPSLVSPDLISSILKSINKGYILSPNCEVTLEANPESVSLDSLIEYRSLGINRLSLGLQAWQNRLLRSLGRIHTVERFIDSYQAARQAGFLNINIDLMFGLPTQTLADWQESLTQIIFLKPEHISCYSLEMDNNSRWGTLFHSGKLNPVPDVLDRKMYHTSINMLAEAGYSQYEISNFSLPGFECRHNLNFWHHQEYLGFGAGAHSYFQYSHFHHPENLIGYLKKPVSTVMDSDLRQNLDTQIMEWLILRLRMKAGFSIKDFQEEFNTTIPQSVTSAIKELKFHKLIQQTADRYSCTPKGFDVYNSIILHLSNSFLHPRFSTPGVEYSSHLGILNQLIGVGMN